MTVASETARKQYTGDGTTSAFSTNPVIFYDDTTINVQVVTTATAGAVTLVLNTDYTISGGAGAVGSVDLSGGSSPYGAPASTEYVVLIRDEPYLQADDFVNNSASDAEVIEARYDKVTMEIQQLLEQLARSIKFPDIETAAVTLPNYVDRASKYLYFDSAGDLAVSDGTLTTSVSDFSYTLLPLTTAAAWRSTLGLVIGTNVQAYSATLTAIAALTPTDSNFIVGNGSAWIVESGATARTSIGLGAADLVTFAAVTASTSRSTLHSVTANGADSNFATIGETVLSSGTAAQKPAGTAGGVRVDTDDASLEFFSAAWVKTKKVGRETLWIPAHSWVPNTTNGPESVDNESTTYKIMYKTLDYDMTTSESAQFGLVMPKNWDLGTIICRPIWTAATGSGTVTWTVAGVAISNDGAIDSAFGTGIDVTDTLLATGDMHDAGETAAITIAGTPALYDWIVLKNTRTISDTLSGDAKFMGMHVYITTNAASDD